MSPSSMLLIGSFGLFVVAAILFACLLRYRREDIACPLGIACFCTWMTGYYMFEHAIEEAKNERKQDSVPVVERRR